MKNVEEDVRFPVLDTRVLVQLSCNLTVEMPSLLAFDNANFPEVKCHMEAFSDLNSSQICSSSVQLVSLEQLKSHKDQQMVVTLITGTFIYIARFQYYLKK